MIKAVVDTNILISSLLAFGPSKAVIHAWLDKRYTLITSNKLLLEFTTTFGKPKFSKWISAEEGALLANTLRTKAICVIPANTIHICRDPKDNMIIETALAAQADIIISGDKDLLELGQYRDIKILPPKKFLEFLNKA